VDVTLEPAQRLRLSLDPPVNLGLGSWS